MKHWIGKWLIGVSVLHTAFAAIVFGNVLISIATQGFFNTVGKDPTIAAAVWFVLFGAVVFISGLAISGLEQTSSAPVPKSIGWSLLALSVVGIVLMPASGFWLVIPPAVAILIKAT
jgi:Family of unknown function (DUF6463)